MSIADLSYLVFIKTVLTLLVTVPYSGHSLPSLLGHDIVQSVSRILTISHHHHDCQSRLVQCGFTSEVLECCQPGLSLSQSLSLSLSSLSHLGSILLLL
jgi:hypothetical protein